MSFYDLVIKKSKLYKSPARCADLDMLEPVTRAHAQAILAQLGDEWMLYETFRSPARQVELFRNGKTDLQNIGVHAFGLAFDIVRNCALPGRKPQPTWGGDFSPLVQAALGRGLVAGLKRKNGSIDYPHVQRIHVADQHRLFTGEWYPDDAYVAADSTKADG